MNAPCPAADIVRTKIVATLGPASRSEEAMRGLVEAGVDVFRLNMAHGSMQEHQESLDRIRRISADLVRPIGVLADLAGPKIRLGELPGDAVECVEGDSIKFIRGTEPGRAGEFTVTYEPLVNELSIGDSVMLADGTISLLVEERTTEWVRCRVVQGGIVRSRQGVNLPGVKLSVAAMSAADWQHAEWAAAAGVDFVSLSFVRSAVEVNLLKELLRTRGSAGVPVQEFLGSPEFLVEGLHPITQAVVDGASRIAGELDAKLFVVASRSGLTAIARSKRRGAVPTIGLSDNPATLRQMALYWGVTPLAMDATHDTNVLLDRITAWGFRDGRLQRGDRILLVSGSGFGTGGHNMALVHEV